jgi:hypothetical protein
MEIGHAHDAQASGWFRFHSERDSKVIAPDSNSSETHLHRSNDISNLHQAKENKQSVEIFDATSKSRPSNRLGITNTKFAACKTRRIQKHLPESTKSLVSTSVWIGNAGSDRRFRPTESSLSDLLMES